MARKPAIAEWAKITRFMHAFHIGLAVASLFTLNLLGVVGNTVLSLLWWRSMRKEDAANERR